MKIAICSPEVVPFSKTGGLADVAGALPKALTKLGVDVSVVTPLYKAVDRQKHKLVDTKKRVSANMDGRAVEAGIFEGSLHGGAKVYFVDMPEYYDRDHLYGTPKGDDPDNAERFTYLSKVIPEVLKAVGFKPDVVHLNDWQTGLVPLYMDAFYRDDPFFNGTGTLYTVHNLGYQGVFWAIDMHWTGLGWEYFTPEGIEFYGKLNIMKAGLVYSDIINTVSKTYSWEIQTTEYGHGLEGVLKNRAADLYGIVNGIDYEEFDPKKDTKIFKNYTAGDIKGKAANKKALKAELGLAAGNAPLFGIISRLADQKGFDILTGAMDGLLKMGAQVAILGTGEEKYHKLLSGLAKKKPKQVSVTLGFDLTLADRIYAGSDVFMMPSQYEPCGLGQLISLRYGTIPLVRKTGGLADTVKNYSPKTGKGNGFVFTDYSSGAFLKAARAAVEAYGDKAGWKGLVTRAMQEDNSWENSAKEYVKLYKKAVQKAALRSRKPE
jgi:starch synthase